MMSRVFAGGVAGMAGLVLVAACTMAPAHPGRVTFMHYCAGCHGASGTGNGALASNLPVQPADLTALKAANGGAFPTEHVLATVHGYPGKHESAVMPEFGPLLSGPKQIWVSPKGEEVMTPVALLDLADFLETLQR